MLVLHVIKSHPKLFHKSFLMKIPMSFLVLLFLPSLLNAKSKSQTIYLPLVHINNTNFFDYKYLAPPLLSPHQDGLMFMAEIFIGSSMVRQYLHIDTCSTLTWNQCYPCSHCFEHIYPEYWPEKSTTYGDAKCATTDSNSNPKFDYSYSTGICTYTQRYADGDLIRGTLAKERIVAQTLDGRFVGVNDLYLGCNRQAMGKHYVGTGILGLGTGDYSLIEKIGSKFSFCFGRVREHDSTHNLILGDDANLEGHPTVIDIFEGQYIFQLESIFVGKEQFTFDNPLKVLLDTGSSISHLSKGLYTNFVDRVSKLIGNKPDSYRPRPCYRVDASKIPDNIDIGFIFAGGAELSVDVQSLFVSNGYPGILCLAIRENPTNFDENIIGAIAMQGYNLGYDLDEATVYFQKRNCNLSKT